MIPVKSREMMSLLNLCDVSIVHLKMIPYLVQYSIKIFEALAMNIPIIAC